MIEQLARNNGGEEMMVDVLSVEDSLSGVGLGEGLAGGLAVDVVISATVDGEVRLFVDDGSGPRKKRSG